MRTIASAAKTPSGRATELIQWNDDIAATVRCPIELPKELARSDCRYYKGFYHTDHTIPSTYFHPAVTRPTELSPLTLDFSYLFDSSIDNPDYATMGTGRPVRASTMNHPVINGLNGDHAEKRGKAEPEELEIAQSFRLLEALQARREE